MASNAPWSVKGIDPKTREAAKEHARRSGMTLGEWLNQRIREEAAGIAQVDPIALPGQAEPVRPVAPKIQSASADSLSDLTERLNAAEQRSTLAITGLDQSVRGVLARMEGAEQTQDALRQKIEERLLKVEQDGAGPRSAEALRALEGSLGKVAHRANNAEARLADSLDEMKREISALSRRLEGLEGASSAPGGVAILEQRMEQLAITLTARVDAAKAEMSTALDATAGALTARVDTAKAEMGSAVDAAGARSAHTVERIGHEVLRMADSLGRRVQGVENRSADAIEQVGGEVARVISSLEARMQKSDGAHFQALEKLSGEIARISEKLSERIAHSERRAAQAIDDVGEQVTRTTERLNTRYDRASSDLAERIRQSEERTARLLEEAKDRIDNRLADGQRRLQEQVAEVTASAPTPPSIQGVSFAERANFADPFGMPGPPVIYPDAAPFGQTFAPAGFTPAEPDFDRADMDAADNFATAMEAQSEADFVAAPVQAPPPARAEPTFEQAYAPEAEAPFQTDSFMAEDFPAPYSAAPYQPEAYPAVDAFKLQAFTPAPAPETASFNPAPEAVSTRNMLDQARAAARAAAQPQGKAARGEQRSEKAKGGGLPFLGRKKNLKNALMMGVAVVALGAMFTGVWSLGMFKGMLPERVANNIQTGPSVEFKGPETDTAPRAAMALNPEPIEANVPPALTDPLPAAPNAMALYNEGAQKIEVGDKSGVDSLKRAANLGLPAAQSYLGRLYEKGGAGLTKDPLEARRWYERAAQAGDRSAMHNLGYYYFEGTAGPKNLTVAAEWFRRASMLGLTDSQYNLARLYEGGLGVSQNPAEAYKWYLLASRAGTTEQRTEARTAANRVGAKISDEARANAERTVQTLAGQINASQDRPQAAASNVSDLALAQRALAKLGYYKGAVDGQMSVPLRLAVQSYQREKNIPATGLVDVVTIQSLRPYIG